MDEALVTLSYEDQMQQVIWQGISMTDGVLFDSFMTNDVASRLYDEEGAKQFESHLRGLATTDFAQENLNRVLAAAVPEERDWAIGEAIAESYLERRHGVTWPWNMERDKRTPKASLPGADLVGFEVNGDSVRLVLGEVKTSSDARTPPNVMNGRSGMEHQIDKLANDLGLIHHLLKWLLFRCKNTEYESIFNAAVAQFLESGNKAVALFGVLIRDTRPDPLDLRARGNSLSGLLQHPATCHLIGVYIPCTIADLPDRVAGCGS